MSGPYVVTVTSPSAVAGTFQDTATWGGGAAWGAITGTITDQADLQVALNGKATAAQGQRADTAVQPDRTVNGHQLAFNVIITKDDVGLGNVDNTSDASKPISAAALTALNLKSNIANPSFVGVTLADASDVTVGSVTGSKIGQSGSKLGFYGVTPVARGAAITQTYATTANTHANQTQLAAPAGGTGAAAGGWSSAANRDLAIASINAARTDITNIKGVLNFVIDILQANGLMQ